MTAPRSERRRMAYPFLRLFPFPPFNCFSLSPASRLPIPRSAAIFASCSARGRAASCSQL